MLDRWFDDIRTLPSRLQESSHDLRERLSTRELRRRARWHANRAADLGREQVWNLQTQALSHTGELLHRAPDLPVIGSLTDAAERFVSERLESSTAAPLENYDELNAKAVARSLHQLDRLGVIKLQRYEAAHKNRKTILDAASRVLERLDTPPAPAAV